MAGADAAFLTLEEADRLVGSRVPEDVRRTLGVRLVVLKDGANGAVVADAEGSLRVPAYPAEVVDPTGAGDAFAGAFVATLCARGTSDRDTLGLAARRGAAAASLAVADFGARALERAAPELIDRRAEELARVAART
jgi:ribokinase